MTSTADTPFRSAGGARLWRLFGDGRAVLLIALAAFVFLTVVWPLFQVVWRSFLVDGALSLANYEAVFLRPRNLVAVWNSLWVSVIATAISVVIGTLGAFLVMRTDIPWKGSFALALVLPFAIAPLFAAMGWVQLIGPVGLISQAWRGVFGPGPVPWNIYSAWGIIFVPGVSNYPLVFLTVAGALQRVDPTLEEAARTDRTQRLDEGTEVALTLRRAVLLRADAAPDSALTG